jgi:acetaldehyde dehydrogenase (acetylating)
MPDVGRTLAVLGTDPRALGRIWLVPSPPALTQRQAIEVIAAAAGQTARVSSIPRVVLRAAGIVVPTIRALDEMRYQFERPFEMDATATTQAFGLEPTPWDEIGPATVAWWRARRSPAAPRAA